MSDTGQPPVSSIPDDAAATGNTSAVLPDSALATRTASSSMGSSSKDPQASYSYVDPWKPDSVLEGYQQATVHLGEDAEGEIVATFVRKDPSKLTLQERWRRWHFSVRGHRLAIMYVHGWNDYFYRRHASEYWESLGIPFYAVDLRKFGRSYRPYQTPGYIEDLHEYRLEFNALRDQIVKEQGKDVRILMIAHSQGGLSASLWVNTEHPHVEALALNSPWLELQGNRMFRLLSTPVVQMYRLRGGKTVMPMRDPGFYARCIKRSTGGEWDYLDHPLNPGVEFLTRAGWMQAIYNGQDEIAKNLDIQIPVLVCTSDKSMMLQSTWDEGMREADSVLDITAIRQAALHLGDVVALATIRGGLHDLSMSKPDARRKYFRIVTMWASMMAWRRVIPTKWVDEALAKL